MSKKSNDIPIFKYTITPKEDITPEERQSTSSSVGPAVITTNPTPTQAPNLGPEQTEPLDLSLNRRHIPATSSSPFRLPTLPAEAARVYSIRSASTSGTTPSQSHFSTCEIIIPEGLSVTPFCANLPQPSRPSTLFVPSTLPQGLTITPVSKPSENSGGSTQPRSPRISLPPIAEVPPQPSECEICWEEDTPFIRLPSFFGDWGEEPRRICERCFGAILSSKMSNMNDNQYTTLTTVNETTSLPISQTRPSVIAHSGNTSHQSFSMNRLGVNNGQSIPVMVLNNEEASFTAPQNANRDDLPARTTRAVPPPPINIRNDRTGSYNLQAPLNASNQAQENFRQSRRTGSELGRHLFTIDSSNNFARQNFGGINLFQDQSHRMHIGGQENNGDSNTLLAARALVSLNDTTSQSLPSSALPSYAQVLKSPPPTNQVAADSQSQMQKLPDRRLFPRQPYTPSHSAPVLNRSSDTASSCSGISSDYKLQTLEVHHQHQKVQKNSQTSNLSGGAPPQQPQQSGQFWGPPTRQQQPQLPIQFGMGMFPQERQTPNQFSQQQQHQEQRSLRTPLIPPAQLPQQQQRHANSLFWPSQQQQQYYGQQPYNFVSAPAPPQQNQIMVAAPQQQPVNRLESMNQSAQSQSGSVQSQPALSSQHSSRNFNTGYFESASSRQYGEPIINFNVASASLNQRRGGYQTNNPRTFRVPSSQQQARQWDLEMYQREPSLCPDFYGQPQQPQSRDHRWINPNQSPRPHPFVQPGAYDPSKLCKVEQSQLPPPPFKEEVNLSDVSFSGNSGSELRRILARTLKSKPPPATAAAPLSELHRQPWGLFPPATTTAIFPEISITPIQASTSLDTSSVNSQPPLPEVEIITVQSSSHLFPMQPARTGTGQSSQTSTSDTIHSAQQNPEAMNLPAPSNSPATLCQLPRSTILQHGNGLYSGSLTTVVSESQNSCNGYSLVNSNMSLPSFNYLLDSTTLVNTINTPILSTVIAQAAVSAASTAPQAQTISVNQVELPRKKRKYTRRIPPSTGKKASSKPKICSTENVRTKRAYKRKVPPVSASSAAADFQATPSSTGVNIAGSSDNRDKERNSSPQPSTSSNARANLNNNGVGLNLGDFSGNQENASNKSNTSPDNEDEVLILTFIPVPFLFPVSKRVFDTLYRNGSAMAFTDLFPKGKASRPKTPKENGGEVDPTQQTTSSTGPTPKYEKEEGEPIQIEVPVTLLLKPVRLQNPQATTASPEKSDQEPEPDTSEQQSPSQMVKPLIAELLPKEYTPIMAIVVESSGESVENNSQANIPGNEEQLEGQRVEGVPETMESSSVQYTVKEEVTNNLYTYNDEFALVIDESTNASKRNNKKGHKSYGNAIFFKCLQPKNKNKHGVEPGVNVAGEQPEQHVDGGESLEHGERQNIDDRGNDGDGSQENTEDEKMNVKKARKKGERGEDQSSKKTE